MEMSIISLNHYAFQGKCVYKKRIPLNEIHAAKKHLLEHKKSVLLRVGIFALRNL